MACLETVGWIDLYGYGVAVCPVCIPGPMSRNPDANAFVPMTLAEAEAEPVACSMCFRPLDSVSGKTAEKILVGPRFAMAGVS